MRVSEMRAREDFDAILAATLGPAWSAWRGTEHRVVAGDPSAPGQRWRFQPLLSAYTVAGVSATARRYLADSFRHTPVRSRRWAQRVLGTVLTTSVGLSLSSRHGFTVDPPIPRARDLLVVPGNQRIRLFDFATGRTRVVLKTGFDPSSLATELDVRTGSTEGPFPAVTAHGDEPTPWLEEPILDAWALPRCPPSVDTEAARAEALAKLDAWLDATARTAPRGEHLAGLRDELAAASTALTERFGAAACGFGPAVHRLLGVASHGADPVAVARSHGDFQPGNILVDQRTQQVTLIDWEHAAWRTRTYDALVLRLGTRSASGLADRLRAVRDVARADLALFLLEDLAFFARDSLLGPYSRPSAGLTLVLGELDRWEAA